MRLNERQIGDVTVLDVHGRIAVQEGADIFRRAIERLVEDDRLKILVNLRETPYIDSTALGEMIRAYTTLTRKGGALKMLSPTRPVHDLLAITNLAEVFKAFDDESAAIASFGKPD